MNWDRISGNWTRYKGRIREKWGFLTDDDLEKVAGKRDVLVGMIQEKYGMTRDRVERALDDFLRELDKAA